MANVPSSGHRICAEEERRWYRKYTDENSFQLQAPDGTIGPEHLKLENLVRREEGYSELTG